MGNPNPLLFLGNINGSLSNNINTVSIFHFSTVTINLLKLQKYFQDYILHLQESVFPQLWYAQSQSITIFRQCSIRQCSMEDCQTISKQWFLDYFLYYNCHYQLAWNYRNTSRNVFEMCNKLFSLNFDMGNPYPSLFLGNVEWKLVKQYKNSDF